MLITLLIIIALYVIANIIYVTPAIHITSEPLPEDRPDDVKKIIELEKATAEAWANGNGEQYGAAYTTRSDYVTFNGEWYKTNQSIADVHQKLFDGVLKGSTLENRSIRDIRFVNDTTAIVHVTGSIRQKGRKKPAKSRLSIQTLVAVKEGHDWKFTAFHNARVRRLSLWDGIMMSIK